MSKRKKRAKRGSEDKCVSCKHIDTTGTHDCFICQMEYAEGDYIDAPVPDKLLPLMNRCVILLDGCVEIAESVLIAHTGYPVGIWTESGAWWPDEDIAAYVCKAQPTLDDFMDLFGSPWGEASFEDYQADWGVV